MELFVRPGTLIDNRFKVLEKIGEGGMSVVFSAFDQEKKKKVALKFLKPQITSSYIEDIIRFKREVESVSRFHHPNIIKVFGTCEFQNVPFIIMELIDGKCLSDNLQEGKVYSIQDSVLIIKNLVDALCYVHNHGILHRDLKPGNVMINKSGNKWTVKLLDFGMAFLMELERIKLKEEIVGTFGYMSPEATGIVNKRIDERSDLYSLGVVFYRLLTGRMPFDAKDVGKLLHQQAAVIPERPTRLNSSIPEVLEKIVMKLLFKEPELRYQSARGLLHDLEIYQKGETDFTIGKRDQKVKFIYHHTALIGREKELKELSNLYEVSKTSNGNILFITGEAGVGKSRLAEEFREYVYRAGGVFVGGRSFDQSNKTPYQPFKDAINEYIRNTVKIDRRDREVKRIRDVLGDLGKIIVKLNPNITEILGEVADIDANESEIENQRFLAAASIFFRNMAEQGNVCVLYLDNLQWADEGSLNLLRKIGEGIRDSNLLIVGTFRDNEIESDHPLNSIKVDILAEEIKLKPFDPDTLNKMISSLLNFPEENSVNLTQYVYEKSNGNPFFAITIVRELVETHTLVWKDGIWKINWDKLKKIPISSSMIDVIMRRVEELPEDLNRLLGVASVIGREFDINLLYKMLGFSNEKIVSLIDEAQDIQLIEEGHVKGRVAFVHDRIREAFYRKLDIDAQRNMHLKIAATLEVINKDAVNNSGDSIFDIIYHYTKGEDIESALKYILPAARKTKDIYANHEAADYYSLCIEFLERKGLQDAPQWLEAREGLAEIYLRMGKSDEAIELLNELLPLKEGNKDKAKVFKNLGSAYFKKGKWDLCEKNLILGLLLLNEKFPAKKLNIIFSIFIEFIIHILHCIFPSLFSKNKKGTERDRLVIEFYHILVWLYTYTDNSKFCFAVLKNLNFTESKLGKSNELGFAYTSYASLCVTLPFFKRAIQFLEKGLKIRRETKDEWGEAQSLKMLGLYYLRTGEYKKSEELFLQAKERFQKLGDQWEIGVTLDGLADVYDYLADYDRCLENRFAYLELCETARDSYGIGSAQVELFNTFIKKGDFEKAEEWSQKAFHVLEENGSNFLKCQLNMYLGILELEKGNFDKSIYHLETAKKLDKEFSLIRDSVVPLYSYLAESYMMKFRDEKSKLSSKETDDRLKRILQANKDVYINTRSWPNHKTLVFKVKAKYLSLINKQKSAEKYFYKALEGRYITGRRYELAKLYFDIGNTLSELKRTEEAQRKWRSALNIFIEIGAKEYIKKCSALVGLQDNTGSLEEKSPKERLNLTRKMLTVFNASNYLSSILDLEELLKKILDLAMEMVGAERGVLMLYPEEKQGELEVKVLRNVTDIHEENFIVSKSIISRVELNREALIIDDAILQDGLREQLSVVREGLRSVLCTPIMVRGEMLGIIYLDNRLMSGLFNDEDLWVLNLISTQAGISIQNARLYNKAVTDGLTGLYNRSFLENYLTNIINVAQRYNKKFSIILFDLDHFKAINDGHGHHVGDLVLKSVAGVAREMIRKSDLAARFGGDEFILMLPETEAAGAKILADRIRKAIEDKPVFYKNDKILEQLTIKLSMGVAEYNNEDVFSELLEKADKALYKAKNLGRARVEVYS